MGQCRTFNATTIDQDCKDLTGFHQNELFFNCEFDKLNGLTLKDCDLNRSKFLTKTLADAQDFTVTLNCHSFDKVEISPLLFDLMLILLYKSTGNDDKREKLLDVVGRSKAAAMLRVLASTE